MTTRCDSQFSRRSILRTTAGFGTALGLGIAGTRVVGANSQMQVGTPYWRFETDDAVSSSPTIVDETVYIGSNDGYVYALDAETGEQQWRFETGGKVYTAPTVTSGHVYVTSGGSLYALDRTKGTQQWRRRQEVDLPSPTVNDETVYVEGFNNYLYAFNAQTGDEQWQFKPSGGVTTAATVANGTVYVGVGSQVQAVPADPDWDRGRFYDGDMEWFFETDSTITAAPTVVDGTVYVGSRDNNIYALNAADGTEQWRFETGDDVWDTLTVADGIVYAPSLDGYLYALNAKTGEQQWRFEAGGDTTGPGCAPTVAGDTVVVGWSTGNVYVLSATDGSQRGVLETGDAVGSSPTVVDGVGFIGSSDGSVYAFNTGANTSSSDSRVLLGTLGHHHVWAGTQSQSLDPRQMVSLEPTTTSPASKTVETTDGFETTGSETADDSPSDPSTAGERRESDDDETAAGETTSGAGPGLGLASGLAGLGGGAYVVHRLLAGKSRKE